MASNLMYDDLFEQAQNIVKNRFLFSVLLAKRVTQLRKGAEPLVAAQDLHSHEEVVYREIIEEKLEWRETPDQPHAGDMEQGVMEGDFDDGE